MANGIGIGVAADTQEFAQAIRKGMIDPTEEAQKALEQIGDAAKTGGDAAERTFKQQAQSTTELRREIGQLNDDIKSKGRQAYQQLGEDAHRGTKQAEEGLDELKQSARQNAIETAASFDGSFSSIAGGAQGLVSEAFAAFGPAAAGAGLAAAAGIGIISNAIESVTQQVEVDKQAVGALAQQYIDAGEDGKRAFGDVAAALEDMATNASGEAVITLKDAYDQAGRAGADYVSIVRSIASAEPKQIDAALRRVQALKDQATFTGSVNDLTQNANDLESTSTLRHITNQAAVIGLEAALKKAKQQATEAGHAQALAAQAGLDKLQQKNTLIEQLHGAYSDAAGAATDYINKESGLFDVKKYIQAMQDRAKALEDYKTDLLRANLTPEAKAFLDSQGADAAAAMVAGYRKASPRQKQELDRIWTAAGRSNASSYGAALGEDLKGIRLTTPPPQLADLTTDQLVAWQRKAQAYLDRHPVNGTVHVVAKTPYGKPIYG